MQFSDWRQEITFPPKNIKEPSALHVLKALWVIYTWLLPSIYYKNSNRSYFINKWSNQTAVLALSLKRRLSDYSSYYSGFLHLHRTLDVIGFIPIYRNRNGKIGSDYPLGSETSCLCKKKSLTISCKGLFGKTAAIGFYPWLFGAPTSNAWRCLPAGRQRHDWSYSDLSEPEW